MYNYYETVLLLLRLFLETFKFFTQSFSKLRFCFIDLSERISLSNKMINFDHRYIYLNIAKICDSFVFKKILNKKRMKNSG